MYHSNLIKSPIEVSPHGSFEVNKLCHSVAICEAKKGDRHNWGNATDTEPAFVVYLGCKKDEVAEKIRYINNALGCYWTENVLWLQLFFVASVNVNSSILPQNTVCCSYIKKQSIAHLFNKVQEVMEIGDPGMGIFTLGFNREVGENGVYYTVTFDWRDRESEEEIQQLDLIAAFMSAMGNQLIDFEGTRDLTRVDGWTAQQLQEHTETRQELTGSSNRSLPAA